MIDTKQMAKYIFEEYANFYSEVDIEKLAKHLDGIKTEAIKYFAEKLKSEINELEAKSPNKAYQTAMEDMLTYYFPKIIDKCLGKMVGEEP